jgi:hypothetical protein
VKIAAIALGFAFALSGTFAFAQPVRHEPSGRSYHMYRRPVVVLHPNYGNPNGNADGPTTLSGTGNSEFGGSSPGTSGYN